MSLPAAARRRLNAASASLRVLALPGDELWTPEALDPGSLPELAELPTPQLRCGESIPAGALVPWAVVPGLPEGWCAPLRASGLAVLDALRRTPRSGLSVQRRVQHRRFGHELAQQLELAPRGAAWIRSHGELAQVREQAADPGGAFVLKPPYSAAGRGHWLVAGGETPDPARLERALERHGGLLHEIWEDRLGDFGAAGWIDAAGASQLAGLHALGVDARGRFRSVHVASVGASPPGLDESRADELRLAFERVGAGLVRAGYRGPFGVDAYVAADGRLRPLVELNARLGFGLLTHALAARLRDAGSLSTGEGLVLRLRGRTGRFADAGAAPPGNPAAPHGAVARPPGTPAAPPGTWPLVAATVGQPLEVLAERV